MRSRPAVLGFAASLVVLAVLIGWAMRPQSEQTLDAPNASFDNAPPTSEQFQPQQVPQQPPAHAQNTDAPPQFALASIQWESSFEAALQKARASNKPIMVDLYTDWCGYCKKLDADTYPAPSVVAESKNFVNVKVDAEKRPELAERYGATGYPTIVWLDSEGKLLTGISSYLEPDQMVSYMREARAKFAPSI